MFPMMQRQGDLFDAFSRSRCTPSPDLSNIRDRSLHTRCTPQLPEANFLDSKTDASKRECQSDIIRVGFFTCQIYWVFSVFHFSEPPALRRRRCFVTCASCFAMVRNRRRIGVQPNRVILSALIASMWREAEANCVEAHRDVCARI